MLNVILDRSDFTVIRAHTQVSHSSALRRSVRFDIETQTDSGQVMDIEVQRVPGPSDAQRARFYSSMIDKNLLEKGDDFGRLPETWVIFINFFRCGNPPPLGGGRSDMAPFWSDRRRCGITISREGSIFRWTKRHEKW